MILSNAKAFAVVGMAMALPIGTSSAESIAYNNTRDRIQINTLNEFQPLGTYPELGSEQQIRDKVMCYIQKINLPLDARYLNAFIGDSGGIKDTGTRFFGVSVTLDSKRHKHKFIADSVLLVRLPSGKYLATVEYPVPNPVSPLNMISAGFSMMKETDGTIKITSSQNPSRAALRRLHAANACKFLPDARPS